MEERLSQHYAILKRFLAQSLRDEKGNTRPNRARDKLLRLSPVQFQELSTDVYDELLRRQSSAGQQTNGPGQVPPYLLPKDNFHPKRNQARQKLATLPPPRFQDLATDVFYELERRFPMFAGNSISRIGSPAMSMRGPPSRVGSPNGMRPNYGQRNASLGSQVMAGLGIPGAEGSNDNQGRPMPKTSQSNTIIPNKSTMVEDDDEEGSDIYGSRRDTTFTSRSMGGSDKDRKAIAEFETQVEELQVKVKGLEGKVREKDSEMDKMQEFRNEEQNANNTEREKWTNLQSDLEHKLTEARNLNNNLQAELDKVRNSNANTERELRSQVDTLTTQASMGKSEWKARYDNLDKVHQELRSALLRQDKITTDVKQEAAGFLNQMRSLSERSNESEEREENLVRQVHKLEKDVQEWKSRYARKRTQARTLRASAMAIPLQQADAGQVAKDGDFTAQDGLVKHIDVTRFQIAIDELLQSARGDEPNAVLARVKPVVIAIRDITIDLGGTQSSQDEAMQRRQKLRAKVSATANNLVTASKNFAMSKGLSPVSLLDAAASHLTSSTVELIRLVKIRPTPAHELEEQEENDVIADSPADFYGMSRVRESTGADSVYSTVTDPRRSVQPATQGKSAKLAQNEYLNGAQYAIGPKPTHGIYKSPDNKMEELRTFLESRTDRLIPSIQALVSSIRTSAGASDILDHLAAIVSTTSQIIATTHDASPSEQSVQRLLLTLSECVDRLEDKGREGEDIEDDRDWATFAKGLPPLAFEIARSAKELRTWVEGKGKKE